MAAGKPEAVVFAKGVYTVRAEHGTATVTIPRSITLGEISHVLAKLYEGRQGETT